MGVMVGISIYGDVLIVYYKAFQYIHQECKYVHIITFSCYFTEKPYRKQFERNVIYIPIISSSHATSHTST